MPSYAAVLIKQNEEGYECKSLNNNKMERLNGEIRDREKVVRGVKKEDSPLIAGMQIYHNYVWPHMALEGKTPADLCGIKVEGNDKWLTLIQAASRVPKIDGKRGCPQGLTAPG
jgi:hypothetical protein